MQSIVYSARAIVRLIAFPLITGLLASAVFLVRLFGARFTTIYRFFKLWKQFLVQVMGIDVEIQGDIPSRPGLIMPNHRSYADILILPSEVPLVFVAKAEVERWPVLGWGANSVHTVWVDRACPDSRKKTREQILERLDRDESVIVFPEGTTHRGPEALDLKKGMFHVAAMGEIPIFPVAIEYENQDMAWIGADTFVPHFIANFGRKRIRVKVRFGNSFQHEDHDILRNQVHKWMNKNLFELRDEWENG